MSFISDSVCYHFVICTTTKVLGIVLQFDGFVGSTSAINHSWP